MKNDKAEEEEKLKFEIQTHRFILNISDKEKKKNDIPVRKSEFDSLNTRFKLGKDLKSLEKEKKNDDIDTRKSEDFNCLEKKSSSTMEESHSDKEEEEEERRQWKFEEVPDDLIMEILGRTSVRTLISYKLLSKNWHKKINLIKRFPSYLSEAQDQISWYYLLIKKPSDSISELGFYQHRTEKFNLVISASLSLPHINSSTRGKRGYHGERPQVIVGEVNGIVCLGPEPVTLVDPIKGTKIELPLPKQKYRHGDVALGFMEKISEYSLISVVPRNGWESARRSLVVRFRVGRSTSWEFTDYLFADRMSQGIGIGHFIYFVDIMGKMYCYCLEVDAFIGFVQPTVNLELERGLQIRHAITLGRRGNQLTVMQVHFPTQTVHMWINNADTWTPIKLEFPSVWSPRYFVSMITDIILWWPVRGVRSMVLQDLRSLESELIRMCGDQVDFKDVECIRLQIEE